MELKKLKQIKNTHKYAYGKDWTWKGDPAHNIEGFKGRIGSSGANIATNGINFAGSMINAYGPVKEDADMMTEAGTSVGYGSGFTYQKQNAINQAKELSELSAQNTNNTLGAAGTGAALGASIGSIFPGLGTVIGGVAGAVVGGAVGILGGASRKRRLQRKLVDAQSRVQRTNAYNLASGQSNYLANQYNLEHENTQDDQLYFARNGKDIKRPTWIRKT